MGEAGSTWLEDREERGGMTQRDDELGRLVEKSEESDLINNILLKLQQCRDQTSGEVRLSQHECFYLLKYINELTVYMLKEVGF